MELTQAEQYIYKRIKEYFRMYRCDRWSGSVVRLTYDFPNPEAGPNLNITQIAINELIQKNLITNSGESATSTSAGTYTHQWIRESLYRDICHIFYRNQEGVLRELTDVPQPYKRDHEPETQQRICHITGATQIKLATKPRDFFGKLVLSFPE